jgi:conjugal transfer pilin signal peptidase TrbI
MKTSTSYWALLQAVLFGFLVIFGSIFGYLKMTNQTIGFNVTESLPQTLFLVKESEPFSKGDMIQFAYKADEEKFLPDGSRIIKKVVGVPGDVVRFEGNDFFINDVKFGKAKEIARSGRALTKNVAKTLSEDEYFVFTPHPDSFDSRYIHMGYISNSQVVGKVVLAW